MHNTIHRRGSLIVGLSLTSATIVALELLWSRLLSVIAWNHFAFFSVTLAMAGISAAAVRVYGRRETGEALARAVGRSSLLFTLSIPLALVAVLWGPNSVLGLDTVLRQVLTCTAVAVPFYLGGMVITLVLTRFPLAIGIGYGVDLVGAALGCWGAVALLETLSLPNTFLALTALSAAASVAFFHLARAPLRGARFLVSLSLLFTPLLSCLHLDALEIRFAKGQPIRVADFKEMLWNSYSALMVKEPYLAPPFLWGPLRGSERLSPVLQTYVNIDADAGTTMTHWNGDRSALRWTQYDVTSLPLLLRRKGDVAVIGVGGGRDILTALAAESHSIVGIEVNSGLISLLQGSRRLDAGLADRPDVRLVNSDARAFFAGDRSRYDVIQMSLIDTWAATGAGAFTFTENALYTHEAWALFLKHLKPGGFFAVSRWYDLNSSVETKRMVYLATAALLENGKKRAAQYVILVTRDRVTTLLVSADPISAEDLRTLKSLSSKYGFTVQQAGTDMGESGEFLPILRARSLSELQHLAAREAFDLEPPGDNRPFFFNVLRPWSLLVASSDLHTETSWLLSGNRAAFKMLFILLGFCLLFALLVIVLPVLARGLPKSRTVLGCGGAYFAAIGMGYNLVQLFFIQRFSLYLGHPVLATAVVLFGMILCTGLGSLLSGRLYPSTPRSPSRAALSTAGCLLLAAIAIGPLFASTAALPMAWRAALSLALIAPPSILLGLHFPLGMRATLRHSPDLAPWMWAVNGAFGVLGSVTGVCLSMWAGLLQDFAAGVILYFLLAPISRQLWSLASPQESEAEVGSELPQLSRAAGI